MKSHIKKLVYALFIFTFYSLTAVAVEIPQSATVLTSVKDAPTHEEKLVVKHVTPQNSGETIGSVRVKFLDSPVELQLRNAGSGTWESRLTPEQVAALTPDGTSRVHPAKVYVQPFSYGAGQLPSQEKSVKISVKPLG